jgi:hypothetical protein
LSVALVACGGASYSGAVAPTTVNDAERDIDAAEATLGSALGLPPSQAGAEPEVVQQGAQPSVQSQQAAPPGPTPGLSPQPSTNSTSADEAPAPAREEDHADVENRCETACNALSSMLRAVDRLCSLTGQGEERCQNARTRANRASERVAQACPTCSPA